MSQRGEQNEQQVNVPVVAADAQFEQQMGEQVRWRTLG